MLMLRGLHALRSGVGYKLGTLAPAPWETSIELAGHRILQIYTDFLNSSFLSGTRNLAVFHTRKFTLFFKIVRMPFT
jgi:hypothetical protein